MICSQCEKPESLCVCDSIEPVKTRTHVLIIQHPQEPDKQLGTALIAHHSLPNSTLKIGLSARNLSAVLGHEAKNNEWLVLYLGSAKIEGEDPLVMVDKKGKPLPESKRLLRAIKGIVVLDGTWSQAKSLWWRNPWLLKLQRGVLNTKTPSLYGKLRREPREESISTIESIAETLSILESDPQIKEKLLIPFRELLKKYKLKPSRTNFTIQPRTAK